MINDLTVGKTNKVLLKFCLPLFGSVIFQQIYNIADSLVAGKFIGQDALAAVGNSYEVTFIFLAFAFGCNIGCSVVVSRLFGERQYSKMKTAVYTTFISTAVLVAVLMTVGWIGCRPLLRAINTPEGSILSDSALYLDIYVGGLPFIFLYNVCNGVFTALGDSKTPFVFLAVSSVSNIGVDVLFVTVFNMGVAGVAWATFICQAVSAVLVFIFVNARLRSVKCEQKPRLFSFGLLRSISLIAVPSILQQSFVSVGNILIQGVINSFGPAAIAGYSAAIKLNSLTISATATIGNGMSNYTAQNLGAGKLDRVREGWFSCSRIELVIAITFAALYFFAGGWFIYLFLDSPTGAAMDTGVMFLRIVAPFYVFVAFKHSSDGVLRGAGKMKQFMATTFSDLIIRVILAYVLAPYFGTVGIWLSWPLGWIVGSALALIFCLRGAWMKKERCRK